MSWPRWVENYSLLDKLSIINGCFPFISNKKTTLTYQLKLIFCKLPPPLSHKFFQLTADRSILAKLQWVLEQLERWRLQTTDKWRNWRRKICPFSVLSTFSTAWRRSPRAAPSKQFYNSSLSKNKDSCKDYNFSLINTQWAVNWKEKECVLKWPSNHSLVLYP